MSEIIAARGEVPGTIISDYLYRPALSDRAQELVVFLHGFQQSGKYMMDKLASSFAADVAILAPNAPYPLPERQPDGNYRLGFTWYFYNPKMDDYYIDMRVALELVEGLVAKLGLQDLPKRVVGFSQGGYLAPFAALRLTKVRQVVGIASEYLPDELGEVLKQRGLPWPLSFRLDQLHGAQDDVVPVQDARTGHQGVLAHGCEGEFAVLPNEGHRLTPPMLARFGELISRIS